MPCRKVPGMPRMRSTDEQVGRVLEPDATTDLTPHYAAENFAALISDARDQDAIDREDSNVFSYHPFGLSERRCQENWIDLIQGRCTAAPWHQPASEAASKVGLALPLGHPFLW